MSSTATPHGLSQRSPLSKQKKTKLQPSTSVRIKKLATVIVVSPQDMRGVAPPRSGATTPPPTELTHEKVEFLLMAPKRKPVHSVRPEAVVPFKGFDASSFF